MGPIRSRLIIAAAVAFIAWGYITDFFPRLLYLPWAFVAGVASTIGLIAWVILYTSNGISHGRGGEDQRRNGTLFAQPQAWTLERDRLKKRVAYKKFPVYPQSKEISKSADGLLDFVIRDFVTSWHGHISKKLYFQNEVDKAIRAVLSDIIARVSQLDIVELATSKFIPIITTHLHDFDEAERAVRGRKLSRSVTESEELNLAIAAKYREGNLHAAASLTFSNTRLIQQQHLRGIVTRLLPKVLPEQMTKSAAVNVLIKELVACAVLYPIVDMLTDPDFWNQQIEAYGRSLLQERKTVKKLRAALDEHAPDLSQPSTNIRFPKLSPGDNERRFERFIRSVRRCNALSDARRFRSEVAAQLRRESAIEGQDALYLRRLETGKRLLDQKIATLATTGSRKTQRIANGQGGNIASASHWETASLRDMLYSASGLSCFMEYMDRQGLMRLVQFWIVVDGIRNPLDADDAGDYSTSWTESDRSDLASINQAYLSLPEVKASPEAKAAVRSFLEAGNSASIQQYHAARRAILKTQTATYEEMQDPYFVNFKKSDLYYKWLASDEAAAAAATAISPSSPKTNGSELSPAEPKRPPRLPRLSTSSLKPAKEPDLRRAVVSSSDLKSFSRSGAESPPRRSLDDGGGQRKPLFDDDDYDTEPLARSTQSIDSDVDTQPRRSLENDHKVVDAMQAALNDIMDEQPDKNSLFSDSSIRSPHDNDSMAGSMELPRANSPALSALSGNKERPTIASLGLIGAPGRRGVFDDDLFGENEKLWEDERDDSDVNDKSDEDAIHEAAPGDLGLAEAIDALTMDIEKLVTQESIVDSLTNKAELTNNAAELKILRKSKASLQREINRKELQRQQYIVQESDNSLYGRASISIQRIMVGQEEDGKEFAMYVVEVRREAGEQMPAAAWVVARRYSEFHELNKRLRARYPIVRNMDFPRRQVVLKLQKDFLQKRRLALERYLRELLRVPAICRSRELRAFLSQQAITTIRKDGNTQVDTRDFVTRIYNSVTDGMEEFLGNIPVLDQLSLAGQNLISAATTQLNNAPASLTSPIHTGSAATSNSAFAGDLTAAAEAEAELRAFESKELEPFVKPICDLFLEAFELNRDANWLRGRAVVVVLHQLLGGTVERKVRDLAKQHLSDDAIVKYLDLVKDIMWPGGKLREAGKPRTQQEKDKSRKEASLALATLVPEVAGSVVGRANASAASRRMLAVLNNRRLNVHLVFTLLDEIIQAVFDEDGRGGR
ncbi:hypothetical protein NA57DRAFT_68438 [Rhizodiscina lignyota]|uniref:Intermediate filament protein n=1 Tax=Rhizodiscina lignyota TaxID=1504668 RepID=A0A9P4M1R8_9PEZI|nr:hypothetical protein NA57DRAFT_68438 [Rhizodiscina lignyota]